MDEINDLLLVELSSEIKKKKPNDYNVSYNIMESFSPSKLQTHHLITVPRVDSDDYVIRANNVTDAFIKGEYNLKPDYYIFFLYDYKKDEVSRNFLTTYGGKIHNETSAGIIIFTIFTPDMVEGWQNVEFRKNIKGEPIFNGSKILDVINEIKKIYEIEKLPAIVVVKKDENGDENDFEVDLSLYKNEKAIYDEFLSVIGVIKENYEADFSVICSKIGGPDCEPQKANIISRFCTYNFIYDKVRDEARLHHFTQEDLAGEMGFNVRTLGNKRSQKTFSRDECLFLAVRFGIGFKELHDLLIDNGRFDLGTEGRDGVIRSCIANHMTVSETNELLIKKGYGKLIKNKALSE